MDDIDEFLNSIEDTPSTERVISGTADSENSQAVPLDAELEALFDDFNTMLGTGAESLKTGPASKDSDTVFPNTSEPEELTQLDIDLVSVASKTEDVRVDSTSPARVESVVVGIAPESVAASIYQQTIDPPPGKPASMEVLDESSADFRNKISPTTYSTTSDADNKAKEGDDFLCWLDDVNSSMPESPTPIQLQQEQDNGNLDIQHASTRAAFLEFLQKESITDPIPPRTTLGAHSSVASAAVTTHMDAFFEEVFGVTLEDEALRTTSQADSLYHASSGVTCKGVDSASEIASAEGDSNGRCGSAVIQNLSEAEWLTFDEYLDDVSNGRVLESENLRVRTCLFQHRVLPAKHRSGVYLYLLGETNRSDECQDFQDDKTHVSTDGIASVLSSSSLARIAEDCSAAVERVNGTQHMLADMKIVLSMFCVRRGVEYHPLYAYLLYPLLCGECSLPRSAAYSLFYKLTTDFIPILDLPSKSPHCVHCPGLSIDTAVCATSQWLRLLLGYHNPLLMQHLDRTVPGWEQPLVWEVDSGRSMAPGMSYMERHNRHSMMGENLNNIENKDGIASMNSATASEGVSRERDPIIGLDIPDCPQTAPSVRGDAFDRNNNGNDIASAHPSKGKTPSSGHIPIHFLCTIFSASVPCEHALELLDWAVISGERFAGVYLTTALLHIFSVFLRNMTGSEIREWLSQVAAGDGRWYKSTLLPKHHFFPNDSKAIPEYSQQQSLSWATFVCGWIHSASAIRRHTPAAFRHALAETDRGWAQEIARRAREEDACTVENSHEAQLMNENVHKIAPSNGQEGGHENINNGNKITQGSAVMSSFRRLSMLATNTAGALGSVMSSGGSGSSPVTQIKSESRLKSTKKYYPHDQYSGGQNVCIWASAQEVIPCFFGINLSALTGVSAHKRPTPLSTLDAYYFDSLNAFASFAESGMPNTLGPRLPMLDGQALSDCAYDAPFYLCLDCRTEAERNATGIFPKALLLDVNFVQDPGRIAEVLTMLEPFVQKVHLCIMGSGEAYVRYMYHRHKLLRPSRTERRLNIGGDGTASGRILAMARSVAGVGAKNISADNSNNSASSGSSGNIKYGLNNEQQFHEDEPALAELLTEYRLQLTTIAMFFLKKSFKHISILDGGFLSVVECLAHMISQKNMPEAGSSFAAQDLDSQWQTISIELPALIMDSNMAMIHNLLTGKVDAANETGRSRGDSTGLDIDSSAHSTSSTNSGTSSRLFAMARNSVSQAAAIIAGNGQTPPSALAANKKVSLDGLMDSQTHVSSSSKDVEDMLSHYTEIADDASEKKLDESLNQDRFTNNVSIDGPFAATSSLSSLASVGASMSNGLASLGGSVKKRFSIFGGNSIGAEGAIASASTARNTESLSAQSVDVSSHSNSCAKPAFVIDDEEDLQPVSPKSNNQAKVNAAGVALQKVSKTEAEKAEAIAVHRLNGLKSGDLVTISKQDLPGTVLFPATKYRTSNTLEGNSELSVQELETRFLVISRERFLVLRTTKGTTMGVGGQATVVLNEHLTQLLRMTFRKRDPEMVTMYFSTNGSEENYNIDEDDEDSTSVERVRRYRVSKRAELVSSLQRNMQRFK